MQRSINMTYFLDMYPRLVYQQIRKDNDTRNIWNENKSIQNYPQYSFA